jgi:hypothetical protein
MVNSKQEMILVVYVSNLSNYHDSLLIAHIVTQYDLVSVIRNRIRLPLILYDYLQHHPNEYIRSATISSKTPNSSNRWYRSDAPARNIVTHTSQKRCLWGIRHLPWIRSFIPDAPELLLVLQVLFMVPPPLDGVISFQVATMSFVSFTSTTPTTLVVITRVPYQPDGG